MKQLKKTNPELTKTIDFLRQQTHKNQAPIWIDVAKRLARPRKNWPQVNVSRLEKHLAENQLVLVPGKLLGNGSITKPFVVGAFHFSEKAKQKINAAGGSCLTIEELLEKNPKGSNIRIME